MPNRLDEHTAVPGHGCISARYRFTCQIIVPRIVIGRVIFEQLLAAELALLSVGPRVSGRVRRGLPVMPQPEAGVEKAQLIVVLRDCRMAWVISHEKTCTYESARAIDKTDGRTCRV